MKGGGKGTWIKAFKGLKKFSVVGGVQVKIVSVHILYFSLFQSSYSQSGYVSK